MNEKTRVATECRIADRRKNGTNRKMATETETEWPVQLQHFIDALHV